MEQILGHTELSIFTQLSLVISLAVILSFIMRALRQPLIIGYVLTGLLVGPAFLHLIQDTKAFESFSEIGIALLLFIIGLGLNATIVRSLGRVVLLTSMIEIGAIGAVGYFLSMGLGLNPMESVIVALSLIFSSTIIIIKVLSDKKEQSRLYGQIAIGVLLVEDLLATFALLFVAASAGGGLSPLDFAWLLGKGLLAGGILYLVATKFLPRLTKVMASSQELLFLFAIGWGFGVATLFDLAGFSLEVGALAAGISLASLPYTQEIAARLKPLRDFFVVLFFIVLGERLSVNDISEGFVIALALSLVALLLKPLFIIFGLGLLGYTKRTSFKAGIHLSQISEFSIVLVVLAASGGLVRESLVAIITFVALMTITISTYMMKYDDKLFAKFEQRLHLFERKIVKEKKKPASVVPLLLFGYKKGGHEFLSSFIQLRKHYLVIDYDPEVIEHLENRNIPFLYGDATDIELLEEIDLASTQLIVSTMTDQSTNLSLLNHIRRHTKDAVFICHADNLDEAAALYKAHATYVILPHLVGSERLSAFIKKHGLDHDAFERYREKHMLNIGEMLER